MQIFLSFYTSSFLIVLVTLFRQVHTHEFMEIIKHCLDDLSPTTAKNAGNSYL